MVCMNVHRDKSGTKLSINKCQVSKIWRIFGLHFREFVWANIFFAAILFIPDRYRAVWHGPDRDQNRFFAILNHLPFFANFPAVVVVWGIMHARQQSIAVREEIDR